MKLLFDKAIYEAFTIAHLPQAKRFVWIATANLKSTRLRYTGAFVPFVDLMNDLVQKGVSFRVIHAELPSSPFRSRYEELDARGRLSAGVEFLHCIRMHAKIFIVDGRVALVGSPNLTGSGIGAKSGPNRNFETAMLFESERAVRPFAEYFDQIWMGRWCPECGRRNLCPAPPV
jgi:phosphatidylserine/phosphatidylglycerophosphate/cardiolipin synthase-like enzyme